MRHLGNDEIAGVGGPCNALAGLRVLHILEAVSNQLTDVEPVMDQATLLQSADDRLEVPCRGSARRLYPVAFEITYDLAGGLSCGILGEYTEDDPRFVLVDHTLAGLAKHGIVSVADRAGDFSLASDAVMASLNSLRELLHIVGVHYPVEGDLHVGYHPIDGGDELYVPKCEMLEQPSQI